MGVFHGFYILQVVPNCEKRLIIFAYIIQFHKAPVFVFFPKNTSERVKCFHGFHLERRLKNAKFSQIYFT